MTDTDRALSRGEELANVIIHFIGLISGIAGMIIFLVMAVKQSDNYNIVGISIFGATVVILYASSILYHVSHASRARRVFHVMDHIAIYLLIAGSYTMFTLSRALRGPWGWSIFGVVWGLAVLGIALKIFGFRRFRVLSMILYLVMGWIVVITLPFKFDDFPEMSLLWLFLGGVSYTVGTIFFGCQRIPYNHAIWHLFVLAGTLSHFIAAYFFIFNI